MNRIIIVWLFLILLVCGGCTPVSLSVNITPKGVNMLPQQSVKPEFPPVQVTSDDGVISFYWQPEDENPRDYVLVLDMILKNKERELLVLTEQENDVAMSGIGMIAVPDWDNEYYTDRARFAGTVTVCEIADGSYLSATIDFVGFKCSKVYKGSWNVLND